MAPAFSQAWSGPLPSPPRPAVFSCNWLETCGCPPERALAGGDEAVWMGDNLEGMGGQGTGAWSTRGLANSPRLPSIPTAPSTTTQLQNHSLTLQREVRQTQAHPGLTPAQPAQLGQTPSLLATPLLPVRNCFFTKQFKGLKKDWGMGRCSWGPQSLEQK